MIGKGAFSTVYKGMLAKTPVAVKVMDEVSRTVHRELVAIRLHTTCVFLVQKAVQELTKSTFLTEIGALTR